MKKNITVAEFLTDQIDRCGKSQKQIADEIGYTKPNIITMFKQGLTKLPINKVGPMAKAIGVDPLLLMKIVMNEYMPDTWEALQDIVGLATTDNERAIIEALRKETKDEDPHMGTAESRKKLKEFAKTLI